MRASCLACYSPAASGRMVAALPMSTCPLRVTKATLATRLSALSWYYRIHVGSIYTETNHENA
jgi:hypothetical protein